MKQSQFEKQYIEANETLDKKIDLFCITRMDILNNCHWVQFQLI